MAENKTRNALLKELESTEFDILILGGGATGSGTALDAAKRGLKVALLEKSDFSSGTSSRSTKLIHGGVRYLAQLRFRLIHEALTERQTLLDNAPHLVKPLPFVLPTYSWYEKPYFSIGMTLYDLLAGKSNVPNHRRISKKEALDFFPSLKEKNLKGGILYYDAQFNDARLNVVTIRGAKESGACIASRVSVESLLKENGKTKGAIAKDLITGKKIKIRAKVVANTTGVWIDEIRKLDDPMAKPVLSPSQGIHLVFNPETIPCKTAMIIPKTSDGRVVFIIPWEGKVILGTTDTSIDSISAEPLPLDSEVDFLIETGNMVLDKKIYKDQIVSIFSGLRPLISLGHSKSTKSISREEAILISDSNLVTMSGGKWSTYRKMGEDLTDTLVRVGSLSPVTGCSTLSYDFPGKKGYSLQLKNDIASTYSIPLDQAERIADFYGGESTEILGKKPKEILPGTGYFVEEVVHFVRKEFALSVADILARRFRLLFLDLKSARTFVSPISKILEKELSWTKEEKKQSESEILDLISTLEKIGK